jgi:hypothetical protein
MRNIKFIIVIIIFTCSCKNFTIIKRTVYSNYFKISQDKLIKDLTKNNIDTSNLFFADNSFYSKIFTPQFQSDSSIGLNEFRPIQFRVFDSSGKIVNTWANCYGPLSYFIKDISDLLIIKTNPSILLKTKITDYTSLMKGSPVIETQKYDIIIIAFWEWYMGAYSIRMLRELQSIPNINTKKVLLIKLNLDNYK